MYRIAIVTYSGLGNLLHLVPTVKALKNLGHNITIFTWPRAEGILRDWGKCKIEVGNPGTAKGNFDYLMIPAVGGVPGNITAKKIIHQKVSQPWGRHESEQNFLDFVAKPFGIKEMPKAEVSITKKNKEYAVTMLKELNWYGEDFVCVYPGFIKGHNWHLKRWGGEKQAENYAELIFRIKMLGYPVIIIGHPRGEKDADKIYEITKEQYKRVYNTESWKEVRHLFIISDKDNLYSSDIRDTLALISMSKLVVGNDGGLQHCAAALGIPTVTIFTFTNPIKNRPYADNAKIVMTPCQNRISCQHGNWKNCQKKGCLDVPIENVLEKIKESLNV